MKIWVAELYLYKYKGDWESIFRFELDEKDYNYNVDKTEFIHSEGWISDRVPTNYRYENTMFGIKLIKGFTKKLNDDEQKDLEQEMNKILQGCILKEKEKVVKEYDLKLEALKLGF